MHFSLYAIIPRKKYIKYLYIYVILIDEIIENRKECKFEMVLRFFDLALSRRKRNLIWSESPIGIKTKRISFEIHFLSYFLFLSFSVGTFFRENRMMNPIGFSNKIRINKEVNFWKR